MFRHRAATGRKFPGWLRHPRTWLVIVLLAIGCYRFSLIDRGHFFWGDERRYLSAVAVVDEWSTGHFYAGVRHFYECYARPAFVLASTLPVMAQRVIGGRAGIDTDTLRSYDIAAGYNVLLSLGVALCLFRLARTWLRCPWYALLVVVVYSLLTCANVWIRHLMPYNQSLLLFLLALAVLSTPGQRDPDGSRRSVIAGALCALGYLSYPTFYLFVVINVAVLLFTARRRFWDMVLFTGGSMAVVGLFELLALGGGTSYIQDLLDSLAEHAGQKGQGHYPEGFVFIWRYLRDVEGPAGIALFLLFIGFVALVLFRRRAGLTQACRVGMVAAIGCYLLHAAAGVFWHKTIFFGRIVGMYVPFLVCGAAALLMHIRPRYVRRAAVCGLLLASVWSFGSFARSYAQVTYPADLLFDTMAKIGRDTQFPPNVLWGYAGQGRDSIEELDQEFVMVADARPEGTENRLLFLQTHEGAEASGARLIGVNLKWVFYFPERDHRFTPPPSYQLIAQAVSPLALPATGYEAHKPWVRKHLWQRRYTMRIYERATSHDAARSGIATGWSPEVHRVRP